jgi:hypothetical protein
MWEELWNAIEVAGTTVCNMPDVLQWTRDSGAAGAVFLLTVMVDHVSFFWKPLVTVQMPFCSQLINCLSTAVLFVYLSSLMLPVNHILILE